ncbi:MAG: sigma-54-dependent Fis family transcriptional regulator [Betaproteobacteria bacterium]|nr:sigma-54-dependent Fis family transcriptional regulator [Betaproteobacteria bacterium]
MEPVERKSGRRILVVDDEERICEAVKRALERSGYQVDIMLSALDALESVRERAPDMVICDIKMPDMDGMSLLERIKEHEPNIPVLMITGHASIESAVEAVRKGAQEYVPKPFSPDQIRFLVERAFERERLIEQNRYLNSELGQAQIRNVVRGTSPVMQRVFDLVARVAGTDSSVLITGESGTGKEVVARLIHFGGARAGAPFVTVNCSAIPNELLESELFGHMRGSFTGALYTKRGSFEQADGGTFFLDEIGDMRLEMQAKILRVLEERRIRRIGAEDEIAVDVRVIAATNKNLREEIKAGRFREDLFYRLDIVQIEIAPLRERKEDIPILAGHFLGVFCGEMKKPPTHFSDDALSLLGRHDWPGNVRELRNAVERALIFAGPGEPIRTGHFPRRLREQTSARLQAPHKDLRSLREVETAHIRAVLEACEGNKARAAECLGISPSTIWRKLQEDA